MQGTVFTLAILKIILTIKDFITSNARLSNLSLLLLTTQVICLSQEVSIVTESNYFLSIESIKYSAYSLGYESTAENICIPQTAMQGHTNFPIHLRVRARFARQ